MLSMGKDAASGGSECQARVCSSARWEKSSPYATIWQRSFPDSRIFLSGASRWADYEKLISQIRPAVHSVTMQHDGAMRFIFDGGGFGLVAAGSSWSKGIDYIPAGLEYR